MKRLVLFIIYMAIAVSCTEEIEQTAQLKYAGTLEVSFAYGDNSNVRSHTFSPAGQSIDVDVLMNLEVGWMVSSDADWCVVDDEEMHRGSGKFTLAVKPNDGFFDRDDATVTLSAGDFSTSLRVIQHGNVFVIDKVYQLSNRTAGMTDILVSVREGVSWELDTPEWVTARKSVPAIEDGVSKTCVTLEWNANESESRFGTIGFMREDESEASVSFSLYQFGSEYKTDNEGAIILEAEPASPVQVKVPVNTFDAVDCPAWVTYETVENEDNTATWNFFFADNPSDTESVRDTEIKFVIGENGNKVAVPMIKQEFYPADGLVTAEGFQLFAERFNSGGDLSSWVNDGVVKVVGHVDMSGLETWTPIGTNDRPFNLKFDGGFRTISNFVASAPLFGVCQDADISCVVFDETCSVIRKQDFVSDRHLAPLAAQISNTKISDCESRASVVLEASSAVSGGCDVYMSGLVACVDDASFLERCSVGGSINARSKYDIKPGGLYIGGIVAHADGNLNITECSSKISVTDSLSAAAKYVGGLIGYAANAMTLDFTGAQEIKSDIEIGPAANVYVGGLIGYSASRLTLTAPSWKGNLIYNISTGDVVSQTGVSGIVGCCAETLMIEGASVSGKISVKANNSKTCTGSISLGGVVGIASGDTDIRSCNNSCDITWNTHSAQSNGHVSALGGIAGRIDKGIALIDGCINSGYLLNSHINNNGYSKGQLKGDRTGGIIGFYGLNPDLDKQTSYITIRNCHNTAGVNSKRGFCGGIAGFLVNASVKNCTCTGNITKDHSNPYAAGIAAGVERTTVEDCDVNASLYGQYQGSCYVRVGGIVAILYDSSSVQNCRYFGNISGSEGGTPRYGCIVGDAEVGCSISKCGVGGTLQGSEVVGVDFNNYIYGLQCPIGGPLTIPDDRSDIQVSECYYWNGIK